MLSKNPQRWAWITLLSGLGVFVVLCIGSVLLARWLVFESPTAMAVRLHVGQGTVALLAPDSSGEQAVRSNAEVERGVRLSTDNLSQGYLSFSDPYSSVVIAMVMLRSDSVATLGDASRPRFNLSDNPYVINLRDASGALEVWVNGSVERPVELNLRTAFGLVRFTSRGNFLIRTTPTTLNVTARDGMAELRSPTGNVQTLTPPATGTIQQGSGEILVGEGPIDLLPYATFETDWPKDWICAHQPDPKFPNAPGGDVDYTSSGGRSTIRLWRLNTGPTPAKTGCYQDLTHRAANAGTTAGDTPGLDIRQYASVRLRVTMQVLHQSLDICGILGTECPVMLHISYIDRDGNSREWYHGFYASSPPGATYPRTCDQCLQPHELINKGAWYTYESGNLVTDWPEDLRPGTIKQIEFYASGHEYDVLLGEVALLATLP